MGSYNIASNQAPVINSKLGGDKFYLLVADGELPGTDQENGKTQNYSCLILPPPSSLSFC